jgi:hypothetical protein
MKRFDFGSLPFVLSKQNALHATRTRDSENALKGELRTKGHAVRC